MRWDKCRYYHDRYTPYAPRDWKPFHSGRPCKDYRWSSRGYEALARDRQRHHAHSTRTATTAPGPEKVAQVAHDGAASLAERFHEHEELRSRKRRYGSVDSDDGHDSHAARKAPRSPQRDLAEEPKAKKHKKSKKKKKSKDKHRERDCRHQDSDLAGANSDADLHRHRKKKKKKKRHSRRSQDLAKAPERGLPKATSYGTGDRWHRGEGSFLLATLPGESLGPLRDKAKHLRPEGRASRCRLSEHGQGD